MILCYIVIYTVICIEEDLYQEMNFGHITQLEEERLPYTSTCENQVRYKSGPIISVLLHYGHGCEGAPVL